MGAIRTFLYTFTLSVVIAGGLLVARAQLTLQTPLAAQSLTLPNSITQVVAPNPTRRGLLICNAGATNDAWVAPIAPTGQTQVVVAANGAGSLVISRTAAAAASPSCLSLPTNIFGTPVQSLVTAGFNGITNASTTPLTVWEF